MAYGFRLPDIGEGLHEAEVLQWYVQMGEKIEADQPVVEVQTDKAAVEIASPVAGTVVSLGGKPGDTIKVGDVLIAVDTEGDVSAAATAAGTTASAQTDTQTNGMETDTSGRDSGANTAGKPTEARKVQAAPAVRKLATDLGVNLRAIIPSHPSGRITRADVERAAEFMSTLGMGATVVKPTESTQPHQPAHDDVLSQPAQHVQPAESVQSAQTNRPTAESDQAVSNRQQVSLGSERADWHEPIRGLRKRIYQNMAKSVYTAPQATAMDDLDATRLVELRKRLLPHAEARGIRLTYLAVMIKAVSYVLRDYPIFNASVDDEQMEIVYHGSINMGVATATPEGLIVPVIRNTDEKSVFQIAAELDDLARRARERKLELSEVTGSTFTISSTGAKGSWFATPIVNYPEVAVLGVHTIQKRAVVLEDDSIVPQQRLSFSLTFDHRVIDGEPVGQFITRLKEYLEHPELLMAL